MSSRNLTSQFLSRFAGSLLAGRRKIGNVGEGARPKPEAFNAPSPLAEGYKAWFERKRAKQAIEAEAQAKRPMSEKQRAALDKARRAKLLKQLPVSELSDA